MSKKYDAVVIGGGACGLMCAVQAGYLGKSVLIIEKNDKLGAKILISGGGRCNYTNLYASKENYISENPHFLNSSLSQWTVEDTIAFFEANGIYGQEKTLGQLFPKSNKAKDIIDVFANLCEDLGQDILLNSSAVSVEKNGELFEIIYERNGKDNKITAPKVVMASGGLPIAKMGATDFALKTAVKFGLTLTKTAPALVPLTITGKDQQWFANLSGNSIFSVVSNDKISFEENILFTHWGLSGPAILQISSYWRPGEIININLLPDINIAEAILKERQHNGKKHLSNFLSQYYTKKFVEALESILPIHKNLASLSKEDLLSVENFIHHFKVKPAGDKGYDKAEVMRGGVSTNELSSKTLESKKVKGLYFGGECVDITGWLGGYNFQWAWASGYVIAQNI
ncbi:HI0933 family protein [Pseudopedobacter saltans DSM 12145]|uniref:HI0933 family protein n=1 Tax=Pseudopedobacter saltans (strain ATCC 51119 / DSM 12145 / JCM 21818 / CCUG 39354 / LMG 10337 / NBRC 100064 / NCIMB 13643) TaxID=762903 RepID=F0SEL9_PSESL|nr:NAD(P)/FAD-dependent oxidoreductase [Pseudopedobacter saltans]ADY51909.1 HI0933 family protein [Pseudopedobacter saltans DSM 12145]